MSRKTKCRGNGRAGRAGSGPVKKLRNKLLATALKKVIPTLILKIL